MGILGHCVLTNQFSNYYKVAWLLELVHRLLWHPYISILFTLHWIFTGYWYWLNNFNDGRMCYAALPGDVVRFRSFPCSDLLRVICQYGSDDTRPLLRQKPLVRGPATLTPPERPEPPKPKVKQKQSLGKVTSIKIFFFLTNPLTVKSVFRSTGKLSRDCPL